MRKILLLSLLLACVASVFTQARVRTTQRNLHTASLPVQVAVVDSLLADSLREVDPNAVSLRGFNKRASDSKESFFVTNNTRHRLSAVRLLLRYTALDGTMLHERRVTVPVDLDPGETQLAQVRTWDVQRAFYFYAGPKPRKAATPFKVAFRLTGYDIAVGR